MEKNTTSDFWNRNGDIPINGPIHLIHTSAGVGSLWDPTPTERAAIADGQPVLLWFPGLDLHPSVYVHALEDPADDPTLAIPPESGLHRVLLVGGPAPLDGAYVPASYGRALVYRSGPEDQESYYEAYAHIPGDPEDEYQHCATYLADNIPGADYAERTTNLAAERALVDAWRIDQYRANNNGIIPPGIDTIPVPLDRAAANIVLIKYPEVPQPIPPGP